MSKILIYSAGTGGGHLECAKVLQSKFIELGHEVVIVDFLKEINIRLDKFIVNFNSLITGNLPNLYGHLYYGFDNEINQKRFTSLLIKITRNKLYNNIIVESPDLIIGTHSFLNGIIGYLKKNNLINIPFISLITDYIPHQNHIHEYIDAYITGGEDITQEFVNRNVPKERVYPFGIPIRDEFLNRIHTPNINKTFQILVMGGSLGLKDMKKSLQSLSQIERDIHITVISGNNIKLKEYFEKTYKDLIADGKITIYGYYNDIATLMYNSDVLITKPGGITITEAISMNLPIIVPYFIPGQEKENLKYLIDHGLGIFIKDQSELDSLIEDLMDNDYILHYMQSNMKKTTNTHSVLDIINLCEDLIQSYRYGGVIDVV